MAEPTTETVDCPKCGTTHVAGDPGEACAECDTPLSLASGSHSGRAVASVKCNHVGCSLYQHYRNTWALNSPGGSPVCPECDGRLSVYYYGG